MSKTTKYIAQVKRAEINGELLNVGQSSELKGLSAEAIAGLISKGYYRADGELPEDVAAALKLLGG